MPKVKRLILGVTGGIASGKTTVMNVFARRGVPIISSDDLAHGCIRRGQPAYKAIVKHFGPGVLDSSKQIDRKKLGEIVFADPQERRQLEKIVHPCVAKGLKRFIQKHQGVIALDIPLLFEAKYQSWVDRIVVVYSSTSSQVKRLKSRNGYSRAQALARIQAQMPLSQKRRKADIVFTNTADRATLARNVGRWVDSLAGGKIA